MHDARSVTSRATPNGVALDSFRRPGTGRAASLRPMVVAMTLAGCLLGCASVDDDHSAPALDTTPVPLDPMLADDVVALTAELIQKRPENPPGDEGKVVDVVAAKLSQAGFTVDVRPFDGPTRTNLLAVLPGEDRSLPPFILLGHTDVVPAEAAEWSPRAGPWDGAIDKGALAGRGALDMLGMVALQTQTMIALKAAGVVLARDVALVLTGDEEIDGKGVVAAIEAWPHVLRPGARVLTEGSYFLESMLAPGEDIAAVAVAEKGLFQFRLRARGPSGHGSTPQKDSATDRLVRAARRIVDVDRPLRLTTPTERMFGALGKSRGGVQGAVMANPPILLLVGGDTLAASATTRALLSDTCALTMMSAGQKVNVVPSMAEAVFDCRILPGTDPAAFRDEVLRTIDDPKVELLVISAIAASGSPDDDLVMHAIRARMKSELPAVAVVPILTKGATDARLLRSHGLRAYGYVPIRITADELDSIHGKDERVRVLELKQALPRLVDITAAIARSRQR